MRLSFFYFPAPSGSMIYIARNLIFLRARRPRVHPDYIQRQFILFIINKRRRVYLAYICVYRYRLSSLASFARGKMSAT